LLILHNIGVSITIFTLTLQVLLFPRTKNCCRRHKTRYSANWEEEDRTGTTSLILHTRRRDSKSYDDRTTNSRNKGRLRQRALVIQTI